MGPFLNNRVSNHTNSYLRWIIAQNREYPTGNWRHYAERAAVELVRRGAL